MTTVPAWSRSESFNEVRYLVAYLGPTRPAKEGDFPQPGENSTGKVKPPFGGLREPLDWSEGWEDYRFEWDSPRIETTRLYFAVGTTAVWEAHRTHFIDDIELVIEEVD